MVKRCIEQNQRNGNFEAGNGNYEKNGNGKPTGSVLKETITVSVTMSMSVQKMTQPNPSPISCMQQDERKASRTCSFRGISPKGRMFQWPYKDYLKRTLHPPECLFYKTKSGDRFG